MFKRETPSFRTALGNALVRSVLWTLCLGVGFLAMTMWAQGQPIPVAPEHNGGQTVMDTRPLAKGSPEEVLTRMGDKCWTGDAPADVDFPGHVVYSNDATGAHVGGARMVGIALDSIFKKPVKGLTVYAFCR